MPLADLLMLVRNGFRMETLPGPIPHTTIVRLFLPGDELHSEYVYSDGCVDTRCSNPRHRKLRAKAAATPTT